MSDTWPRVLAVGDRAVTVELGPSLEEETVGRVRALDERLREASLPGVLEVSVADTHDGATGFEISSEKGRDIRRDLARAVVSQNWGLLELRPSRMSLEEIFLSLTTEEKIEEKIEDKAEETAEGMPHE